MNLLPRLTAAAAFLLWHGLAWTFRIRWAVRDR